MPKKKSENVGNEKGKTNQQIETAKIVMSQAPVYYTNKVSVSSSTVDIIMQLFTASPNGTRHHADVYLPIDVADNLGDILKTHAQKARDTAVTSKKKRIKSVKGKK